ncbi:uncharacterized protein LOC131875131 [Cryptomeria japonica]|uniref:uncharacterized protein LOC131875131 n=1 Tax=Cryptomeria japonica TaxID=3369 RepID=UPI0027DA2C60|nr:uncharacterized protein LOC131875131 [Cryptomeria japonica]
MDDEDGRQDEDPRLQGPPPDRKQLKDSQESSLEAVKVDSENIKEGSRNSVSHGFARGWSNNKVTLFGEIWQIDENLVAEVTEQQEVVVEQQQAEMNQQQQKQIQQQGIMVAEQEKQKWGPQEMRPQKEQQEH